MRVHKQFRRITRVTTIIADKRFLLATGPGKKWGGVGGGGRP